MEKIWDKGPWTVNTSGTEIHVESEDFTHDVSLCVYGDFKNKRERVAYAKFIAKVLNGTREG